MGKEQPQKLSPEEQQAVENKKNGLPYDKKAYKSAEEKRKTNEKYDGERNQQKRESVY